MSQNTMSRVGPAIHPSQATDLGRARTPAPATCVGAGGGPSMLAEEIASQLGGDVLLARSPHAARNAASRQCFSLTDNTAKDVHERREKGACIAS